MDAVTFIAFVQPRSFWGAFSFSWRGMMLYSASCFGGNVCKIFTQFWMRLCICLRFLRTFLYSFVARCVTFAYLYRFCARCEDFSYGYGLSSQCWMWAVTRDPIFRVLLISLYVRAACSMWTVSRDLILRVPSISFVHSSCSSFTVRIPWGFLGGLDKAILPSWVILLCTMLFCGRYINLGEEGYFGCNDDIV